MTSAVSSPGLFARRRRSRKRAAELARSTAIERQPGGMRILLLTIGMLTLAVLPHLTHLRIEIIGLFLGFALWRLTAARFRQLPRNRWVIMLFALVGFTISAWHYGPPLGRDPGVAFLIVMAGLKCVEVNVTRDLRILVLLSLFIIVTHFLYADGINWVIPLAGLVAGLTWLMAQIERAEPERFPMADLRMVGKLLLQALPFVIILFYLFPRLSGSLFLLQSESNAAVTGLSDSLTMGTVSNLIQSDETAFTATFSDGNVPPYAERYWRGGVLWQTDGREWVRGPTGAFVGFPSPSLDGVDPRYRYEVDLEPTNQRWLYTLDYPTDLPERAIVHRDYQLSLPAPIEQPYRYQISAAGAPGAGSPGTEQLSAFNRRLSLDLGATIVTERLDELVSTLRAGAESNRTVVERTLAYFREQPFVYTLQPPLLNTPAPVDEFLFESRRGFCGHYASSFATLMRRADIPTRLVVGYLGGELNPRSNQITVKQSAAHAWTEVLLEGRWQRVDPTAAVAPERIEYPIDFNGSTDGDGAVLFDSGDFSGLGRLMIEFTWYKDMIKANWNRWFVTFDQDRQKRLLAQLGLDRFNLQTISIIAFLSALALLTLISFWFLRGEGTRSDPVVRVYQRFTRRLAKRGLPRLPGEGPVDFATRAARKFPNASGQIRDVTDAYVRLRYAAPAPTEAGQRRMAQRLNKLVKQLSLG